MTRTNPSPHLFGHFSGRAVLAMSQLMISLAFVAAGSSPGAEISRAVPEDISPGDARLRYEGRLDWRNPQEPGMTFPGAGVVARFQGTGFEARLSTTIADRIQVVVDGKPTVTLVLTKAPAFYPVVRDLPAGEHTVALYKCTEAFHGTTRLYGLRLPPGTSLLPAPEAKRHIEFIGDSITCGYGNLAANRDERFSPANSSWYFSYGAIAARELGAAQVTVAVSGIRLTKFGDSEAMPTVYRRVDYFDRSLLWDFHRGPVPDVIVIDLCTNDFGPNAPDEALWVKTYNEFLDFVRSVSPSAQIFLANGPMMPPGQKLDDVRAWNREVVAQRSAAGDSRIHAIDFAVQRAEDGYGSDWHPSVKTDQKMADRLVEAIKAVANW